MTSLAEVYGGTGTASRRRLYLGTALFGVGACLVVVGIVFATTDVLSPFGVSTFGSRKIAGTVAGLGVPAVFVGIFSVLPASPRERAVASIGASIAVFGVVLFWRVYPDQWYGATANHLTLPVVAVYFVGAITTFWALFFAVVNFKTRNDPGGTVTLSHIVREVTQSAPRPAPEPDDSPPVRGAGLGGVGVLGDIAGEVMADESPAGAAEMTRSSAPTSDGGQSPERLRTPRSDRQAALAANPDRYCGNCAFFDYVPTDREMRPYCGHHDEFMDDMDPCDVWEPYASR